MEQTQQASDNPFEGLSADELLTKVAKEGGREALDFAMMVIAFRAMKATDNEGLRTDIAGNIFAYLKGSAIESMLLATVKRCKKDKKFRDTIEKQPVQAMVIMGITAHEEKGKIAGILHNLCQEVLGQEDD